MKVLIFSLIVAISVLTFGACQSGNQQTTNGEPIAVESIETSNTTDVVTSTLTDANGNTLYMEFDNSAGVATFVFGQDTIFLKQDTTASGIRYSDDNYIFIEHQGDATLTKDGEVVFKKGN